METMSWTSNESDNTREWDWSFMLEMERRKLKRMANWFEKNGCHENVEYDVSKMRLAVKLLDIVIEDTDSSFLYINLKNINRFLCPSMSEWTLKNIENGELMAREGLRVQKAWYLYNKLRYYFLRNWWD